MKAAELITPAKFDVRGFTVVSPTRDRSSPRRNDATPTHLDTGHVDGSDHDNSKGSAVWTLEQARHALIACVKPRDAFHRIGSDGELTPRNVTHLDEAAVGRHVDPVTIVRGEVQGGELALCEFRVGTSEQFVHGEGLAFRLDNPTLLNLAELADSAVAGCRQCIWVFRPGSDVFFQSADEQGV